MKLVLSVIILVFVVLISGCTQQQDTVRDNQVSDIYQPTTDTVNVDVGDAEDESVADEEIETTEDIEENGSAETQETEEIEIVEPEIKFTWTKDQGTRTEDGSVPYIKKVEGGYRLYFCGQGGILSAFSKNGLDFQKDQGVRLSGEGEFLTVCDATLVDLEDEQVRMYYKGAKGQGGPGQAVHKVFSAISEDGLTFQKEGLRIDSEKTGDNGWASVPEAIKLPDGRVRIFYVSGDFEAQGGTMSAVSSDGLKFTKEKGARVKTLVDPAVTILPDGTYLLLAIVLPPPPGIKGFGSSVEGIYSFTSKDGLNFENKQTVLEEKGVYDPSIVQIDQNTYRIFYGKDSSTDPTRPNIVTKSLTGELESS